MTETNPTTINPVVMSTTSASSGDRSATPPIPGGVRDGILAVIAGLLTWVLQWAGVPISDTYAMVVAAAILGGMTTVRKYVADSLVKHK